MCEWMFSVLKWPGTNWLVKLVLVLAALSAGSDMARAEAATPKRTPTVVKTVCVHLGCERSDTIDAIVKLFGRKIEERCEARVKTSGPAEFQIELALSEGIGKEGFRIEDAGGAGVRIVGSDARGLLYGVGKFLRT